MEFLCVRVKLNSSFLFIIIVYIPPGSSSALYDNYIKSIEAVNELAGSKDDLIVVGDFNLPHLSWTSPDDDGTFVPSPSSSPGMLSIIDGISACNLYQRNDIINHRGRLLDLVFTSSESIPSVLRCDDPLVPEVPDHPALCVHIDTSTIADSSFVDDTFHFNFNKIDSHKLNLALNNVDWSLLYNCNSVNACSSIFYSIMFECFVFAVPIQNNRNVNKSHSWFDDELRRLRKTRNNAWKTYSSSKSPDDYIIYSNLRSQFKNYAQAAYSRYIGSVQEKIQSDPKYFWSFVNAKRKGDGYPNSFLCNNEFSQNPSIISNSFASYFASAYKNGDNTSLDYSFLSSCMSNLPTVDFNSFTIDENALFDHVSKLDSSTSVGPDGIPNIILKDFLVYLSEPLLYLFNLSLSSGVFPCAWKSSYIIPVFKKGNKDRVENYRPIAKLSAIPKLFESIVCEFLTYQCKSLISSKQHGFVKGRSTSTALVSFTSFVNHSLENGCQVDCIYTDFSKAFDKICHKTLLFKLACLGFPPIMLNWIASYLSDRTQQVKFRSSISDVIYANSGVPQGSHLGPLFFILFINELPTILKFSQILMFADDVKIFNRVKSVHDCILLQNDLDKFSEWCTKNKLILNINKCNVLSFYRLNCPLMFNYNVDNSPLNKVDHFKDLGVIFDRKLNFSGHYDWIINRANSMLGFVKRWCYEFSNPYIIKKLFESLVRPILEYCTHVWNPFYKVHSDRIEAVQKRFLRFALRRLNWNNQLILPPYENRLKLLNMSTLQERREFSGIVFIHQILNGGIDAPDILSSISINAGTRNLRRRDFLYIARHRSNYGFFEPISYMSRQYNKFFDQIDLHLSKSQIKKQFFM